MATNKVSFTYFLRNQYSKVAAKIGRSTVDLRRKLKDLGRTSENIERKVNKSTLGIGSGFKRMFAAAAGFFGAREFLQKGMAFQDAMADLSAITGATGKDLDKLRNKAFELGKGAATSGAQVAEAFKLVASAKPELLENLDALAATTKEVLLLKNAAGIELAEAARITAESLNIFGAGAKSANKFVNILAAGAKLGSSEIADTGAAAVIAGPQAKNAGLSFLQLNAAIQTVAKGGIKGARAGTALSAIFGRLRRGAKGVFQGFDFEKLGLEGVFLKIKERLEGVTDSTKRAQLEAKFFGEEHAKVGLALLDNANFLSQYERTLKGTNTAQEQADIRLGTFSARLRRLGVILEQRLIKVFDKLEPVLTKQTVNFANFLDSINPAQVDAFAESLSILVSVAGIVGDAFKIVLSIFKGVGTAIGELSAQIATMDFSEQFGTSFKDAFSIGGKFLGVFGGEEPPNINQRISAGGKSQTDINVNLNAPEGVVQSVKSKTKGNKSGLNLGVSMVTQ